MVEQFGKVGVILSSSSILKGILLVSQKIFMQGCFEKVHSDLEKCPFQSNFRQEH